MPCANCGQDVPFIPSADDPEIVICAGCKSTRHWGDTRRMAHRVDEAHCRTADSQPTPPLVATDDDWDDMFDPYPKWARADAAHQNAAQVGCSGGHGPEMDAVEHEHRGPRLVRRKGTGARWIQWVVLSLGIGMFTSGAVLIAWSFQEGQHRLWNTGAPLALAGQVAFLVGLVLQLDIIWQQGHMTARVVEHLNVRISAAASDQPKIGVGAEPEVSESGAPERLLSDLKGQLEHIAKRISTQSRGH